MEPLDFVGGKRKEWGSSLTMAKVIFDVMMLRHTGSVLRGWHHCVVNDLNTVFVNTVLAWSMLLPYHPLVLQEEVGGTCSPVHLWSKSPTEENPVLDHVLTWSFTMRTGNFCAVRLLLSSLWLRNFKINEREKIITLICLFCTIFLSAAQNAK